MGRQSGTPNQVLLTGAFRTLFAHNHGEQQK